MDAAFAGFTTDFFAFSRELKSHNECAEVNKPRFRESVQASAWRKATHDKDFIACFNSVRGESLMRPPRGFEVQRPLIGDIKRKSFYAMQEATPALAQSPSLVEEVVRAFRAIAPLMRLLSTAVEVTF
jgi:uncharacterized protein (DUF2461 family)